MIPPTGAFGGIFLHIADHVVQTERIGQIRANGRGGDGSIVNRIAGAIAVLAVVLIGIGAAVAAVTGNFSQRGLAIAIAVLDIIPIVFKADRWEADQSTTRGPMGFGHRRHVDRQPRLRAQLAEEAVGGDRFGIEADVALRAGNLRTVDEVLDRTRGAAIFLRKIARILAGHARILFLGHFEDANVVVMGDFAPIPTGCLVRRLGEAEEQFGLSRLLHATKPELRRLALLVRRALHVRRGLRDISNRIFRRIGTRRKVDHHVKRRGRIGIRRNRNGKTHIACLEFRIISTEIPRHAIAAALGNRIARIGIGGEDFTG